jgi:hypothetical protein
MGLDRLLNKDIAGLMVSDQALPTGNQARAGRPGAIPGAVSGQPLPGGIRVSFGAISARPRAPRFVVNYDLRNDGNLVAMNGVNTGISGTAPNGTWALTTRDAPTVALNGGILEIAAVPAARTTLPKWVRLFDTTAGTSATFGDVVSAEAENAAQSIRNVQDIVGDKVTRTRYFVREVSTVVVTGSTRVVTPASGAARINISSALRAPKINAPSRPELRINANMILVAGDLPQAIRTALGDTYVPVSTNRPGGVGTFIARATITQPETGSTAIEGLRFRAAATARRPASMPTAEAGITIQARPAAS